MNNAPGFTPGDRYPMLPPVRLRGLPPYSRNTSTPAVTALRQLLNYHELRWMFRCKSGARYEPTRTLFELARSFNGNTVQLVSRWALASGVSH